MINSSFDQYMTKNNDLRFISSKAKTALNDLFNLLEEHGLFVKLLDCKKDYIFIRPLQKVTEIENRYFPFYFVVDSNDYAIYSYSVDVNQFFDSLEKFVNFKEKISTKSHLTECIRNFIIDFDIDAPDMDELIDNEIIGGENACHLPASGFTVTLNGVYDWAKHHIEIINKVFGSNCNAHLWSYREQSSEWISFTVYNEKHIHDILFLIGQPHNFNYSYPYVPDSCEALHMIGLITNALKINTEIGLNQNETNKYCTGQTEWKENQTNAQIEFILE